MTHRRVVGVVIFMWVLSAFLALSRLLVSSDIIYEVSTIMIDPMS